MAEVERKWIPPDSPVFFFRLSSLFRYSTFPYTFYIPRTHFPISPLPLFWPVGPFLKFLFFCRGWPSLYISPPSSLFHSPPKISRTTYPTVAKGSKISRHVYSVVYWAWKPYRLNWRLGDPAKRRPGTRSFDFTCIV